MDLNISLISVQGVRKLFKPILHRSGLLSIPIFFEDGGFLLMDPTLNFNNFLENFSKPGLKVINFHPAHICFNTPNFQYTRKIKDSVSRRNGIIYPERI